MSGQIKRIFGESISSFPVFGPGQSSTLERTVSNRVRAKISRMQLRITTTDVHPLGLISEPITLVSPFSILIKT